MKRLIFADCSSLTKVTIPSSITVIYDYIFEGCSKLTDVIFCIDWKIFFSKSLNNKLIFKKNFWIKDSKLIKRKLK